MIGDIIGEVVGQIVQGILELIFNELPRPLRIGCFILFAILAALVIFAIWWNS